MVAWQLPAGPGGPAGGAGPGRAVGTWAAAPGPARPAPEVPKAGRRAGRAEGGCRGLSRAHTGVGVSPAERGRDSSFTAHPMSPVPGAGEGDGGCRRGAHEEQPQRLSAAGPWSPRGACRCRAAGVMLGGRRIPPVPCEPRPLSLQQDPGGRGL